MFFGKTNDVIKWVQIPKPYVSAYIYTFFFSVNKIMVLLENKIQWASYVMAKFCNSIISSSQWQEKLQHTNTLEDL